MRARLLENFWRNTKHEKSACNYFGKASGCRGSIGKYPRRRPRRLCPSTGARRFLSARGPERKTASKDYTRLAGLGSAPDRNIRPPAQTRTGFALLTILTAISHPSATP